MRLRDGETTLRASFDLKGNKGRFELLFHSRWGQDRNPNYAPGLKLVLHRLASAKARLKGAFLDTEESREKGLAKKYRKLLNVGANGLLLEDQDTDALADAMGNKQARIKIPKDGVEQPTKPVLEAKGGNRTRSIRLLIALPVSWGRLELHEYLRTGERREFISMRVAGDMRTGFQRWHQQLRGNSVELSQGVHYFETENLRVKFEPRGSAEKCKFASGKSGDDWIVEINAPKGMEFRDNSLSCVAVDDDQRHWVLRQGVLGKNRISARIDHDFADLTGFEQVELEGSARPWFIVGRADEEPSLYPSTTLEFVQGCLSARKVSTVNIESAVRLLGRDEVGGAYRRLAFQIAEREVIRKQGEVWAALRSYLQGYDITLEKPKGEGGHEVDGEAIIADVPYLFEIKTTTSAHDVYAAVGQLMLYPKLIPIRKGASKVVVLPLGIGDRMANALADLQIRIISYEVNDIDGERRVSFSNELQSLLGLDNPVHERSQTAIRPFESEVA